MNPTPEEIVEHKHHVNDASKVACIMIATISLDLQNSYEDYWPYEMNLDPAQMFHKKVRQECDEVVKSLMA